jgi:hypothetical protein
MKVAILACGEYREFEKAVKSWEFLNQLDCDVYISTWNKSKQLIDIGNYKELIVTKEMIKNHIPNAFIEIQSPDYNMNNINKMVFHIKNSLKMLKQKNYQYDKVLLIRMDLFLKINSEKNFLYFLELNEMNSLYGCGCGIFIDNKGNYNLNNDTLIYGDYNYVVNFIENLPNYIHNIHVDFGNTIKKCGYNFISDVKILTQVVRPKCKNDNLTINYLNQMNLDYVDLISKINI